MAAAPMDVISGAAYRDAQSAASHGAHGRRASGGLRGRPVLRATPSIRRLPSWGDFTWARCSYPVCWPGAQVLAPIRCRLAAGQRTALRCLCTNMWMTCAQRRQACAYAVEMLGIPPPGRTGTGHFTWENASHILCIQGKLELSTRCAAINNYLAECLSQVYSVVIRRRNREALTLETMSPSASERGAQAQRRQTPRDTPGVR
jgi:hypothetical protein